MKAPTRLSCLIPLIAWLGVPSCFTENPAAYQGILGETRPSPDGSQQVSTASGTQGDGVGGTGGGPVSSDAGAAGEGLGGTAGGGGASDSDNTSSTTGSTDETLVCVKPVDSRYAPRCCEYLTEYSEEIKKGTQCSPNDVQQCYRECGPASIGWKEEKCQAGVYAEENCVFPPEVDYSCYAIPDEIDSALCGLDELPRATDECDAPTCTLCNVDGRYVDTGDAAKEGYCVCREPDENGIRTWTCASTTAWPCPLNKGC